ncbi:hypothetical protein BABINDRAFT_57433 [Babjeviella inositovora NRRL Y-12698]|uniref:V-type proton ATPase subunit n=1 Tax=Babjeviella inositovora NRRL Y-12698 TaxID=984486 RepID=A0A1E3R000_9ASCO|nr:uncharacterized protein BABINDRAFT_57433 [Babjeviella inositovora NRRL Y-12698]ODQ83134.1 hypothetical protein BABINDRAFT_57433 [Babjeviella inositovora NRRL Y-12698]
MEGVLFNIDFGYLEGVVRGYRNGLMTSSQYINLTQCDNLDDLKLQLSASDYAAGLNNVPGQLTTANIQSKTNETLFKQWEYLRQQAVEPMASFMDYISYGYMIDNVVLLITGTLHERDLAEILPRCNPLGWFDTLPALSIATDMESLYSTVLVDTPLAPFFKGCLSISDLDELNVEVIRNTLYKNYLELFHAFCNGLADPAATIMTRFLELEADRRVINIALNSFGISELEKAEKKKMFPDFGALAGFAQDQLAAAEDVDQIRSVVESISSYRGCFDSDDTDAGTSTNLEDFFYKLEMDYCRNSFTQQFSVSVVYSWLRAKEQEIRNITWIAECIAQNQREKLNNYISVF